MGHGFARVGRFSRDRLKLGASSDLAGKRLVESDGLAGVWDYKIDLREQNKRLRLLALGANSNSLHDLAALALCIGRKCRDTIPSKSMSARCGSGEIKAQGTVVLLASAVWFATGCEAYILSASTRVPSVVAKKGMKSFGTGLL